MDKEIRRTRTTGALLGLALGDALGLPFEGLGGSRVHDLPLQHYSLFGRTGFVSDDTEQTALIAQAFARFPTDDAEFLHAFRRSIVGWFLRLPFGIGFGTLKACLRMTLGLRSPGVRSAGNGAAMRAGIVGVCHAFDAERRRQRGRQVAALTHTDARAIEGALFVAEVAAGAFRAGPSLSRSELLAESASLLKDRTLRRAVEAGLEAAEHDLSPAEAAAMLGTTGFVVHSVAVCTFSFARRTASPIESVRGAIRVGGDTDSHAAIVGGWLGAMYGCDAFPAALVEALHNGPFGPSHLRRLGNAIVDGTPPPSWSWPAALLRNLWLYPVVIFHGLLRIGRSA